MNESHIITEIDIMRNIKWRRGSIHVGGGKKEWGKKAISKVREKWKCEKVKQKKRGAQNGGQNTPSSDQRYVQTLGRGTQRSPVIYSNQWNGLWWWNRSDSIAQGGALLMREIVDTKSHASCGRSITRTNKGLFLLHGGKLKGLKWMELKHIYSGVSVGL